MSTIVDTIAAIVRNELSTVRGSELAVVREVHSHSDANDDDNYAVDVTLKNSGLALKRVPVATGHIGTVAIPNVGDLVLVTFDHGDVNAPIIIGRLFDDAARPPLSTSDQVVFRLPLAEADDKSILAAIRNHADRNPPRELVVQMPPKITVRVVDGVVTVVAGATEVRLDQSGASGGTVTVKAGRTVITLNQDGDVTLDSAGAVTFKAATDLILEAGGDVKVKAGANAIIEAGARAAVKGSLQVAIEGTVGATVQGSTVTVKGQTSFTP